MIAKPSDMTPVVDLTHGKGAGPVRYQRPIYTDLLPPCNNACPAGENIKAGSTWPKQASIARHGKHSYVTTRCRLCMAEFAITLAKVVATAANSMRR